MVVVRRSCECVMKQRYGDAGDVEGNVEVEVHTRLLVI
jgi:hypothetical protein